MPPRKRPPAQHGARYTRLGKRGVQSPRAVSGRGSSLRRTLMVLGALARREWHLPQLAIVIGVTWRTLYRDIEMLRATGIEIETATSNRPGQAVTYRASRASVRRVLGI